MSLGKTSFQNQNNNSKKIRVGIKILILFQFLENRSNISNNK